MATKPCKFCNTEMEKSLTQCPNCQKKQGGKLKYFIIGFVAIGIIAIAIIIAVLSDQDEPKIKDSNNENISTTNIGGVVPTQEKYEVGLGEVFKFDDTLITLTSLTESMGNEYSTPADGSLFLQCEFLIENISTNDISLGLRLGYNTYCDGFLIQQSLTARMSAPENNSISGSLAPGKKLRGVVVYEVSTDWKEIKICYSPDHQGTEIAFIANRVGGN